MASLAMGRTCYAFHLKTGIKFLLPTSHYLNKLHFASSLGVRYYLSPSYECKDAWEKRLQSPLLQNLNMTEFFLELDKKFINKKKVGAVDIDMFASNVQNKEQLEELETLLQRFRRTRQTAYTLESTHHAVVRAFLENKQYDALLAILKDRIKYGIFPDHHSYNLLMDTFLKEKKYKEASDVATLMMLQEDFNNPISRILALNACHLHRLHYVEPSPQVEESESNPAENDDEEEEEEVFVRVPFLRNPFFDDHFDITNPKHLLGKTLYMVGKEFNDIAGRTYQLIGLGLYEKWEKADKLLKVFMNSPDKPVILEEGVSTFLELVNSESSSATSEIKESLQAAIETLRKESLIGAGNLNELVTKKLEEIKQFEEQDIATQQALYEKWEVQRQEALQQQIDEFIREEREKEIEAKKAELDEREKLLFFFENWDKHEMELAEAEKRTAELKPKEKDEDYIPPDIRKPLAQHHK